MFTISVVIALLIISAGDAFRSCNQKLRECERNYPVGFYPKNLEDFERKCIVFQDAGNCVIDVKENCRADDLDEDINESLLDLRHMMNVMNGFCDSHSPIYQMVSNSMHCLYPILQNLHLKNLCREDKLTEQREAVTLHYMALFNNREAQKPFCVRFAYDTACRTATLSKECGSEMLKTIMYVFVNIDRQFLVRCDRDMIAEMLAFAHALEIADNTVEDAASESPENK